MESKRVRHAWITACGLVGLMLCGAQGVSANPEAVNGEKAMPPMVAKHLFMPQTDGSNVSARGPVNATKITYTGFLSTPHGKKVLLETEMLGRDGVSPVAWYAEGQGVGPYVLREIGPDFISLEGAGETLRLPLYGTDKNRPEPLEVAAGPLGSGKVLQRNVVENQPSGQNPLSITTKTEGIGGKDSPQAAGQPSSEQTPQQQQQQPSSEKQNMNPFQRALDNARQGQSPPQGAPPVTTTPGPSGASNPFMEILKTKRK